MSNQYDLLKDGTIPPIDMVITKARYVYLTFGIDRAGTLTHVSLGMPSADNSEWLAFAKLARRAKPEPFFLPPPAPPTPPVAGELKFQPDVAQMLDGQDEKEAGKKSA